MKVWTSRMLAVSLAGHDKGKLYAVVEEVSADGVGVPKTGNQVLPTGKKTADSDLHERIVTENSYLLLADGKSRTLEHPKRKKRKHVQLITHLPQPLLARMSEITLDAHVRKIVRQYREIE
ncbi:MAG: KOW domain-containing RNA-binding protein [Lachnospiraceae bacterium]|nr:KOW domain-containing RNA-binding protein [Lachnospiraceae bacterium]